MKSTRIAAIASLVLPGLGQLYNRQIAKGIIFVILGVIGLALITSPENRSDFRFGLLLYPLFLAYNAYDAYHVATEINESAF
jgi:TM2 domain-containing membrane protein YozV